MIETSDPHTWAAHGVCYSGLLPAFVRGPRAARETRSMRFRLRSSEQQNASGSQLLNG